MEVLDLWTPLPRLSAALIGGVVLGFYAGDVRRLAWLLPSAALGLIWLEHSGYIVIHTERLLYLLEQTLHADLLMLVLAILGVRLGLGRIKA